MYTSFKVEFIPAELKAIHQWVCWRPELRGDKWTKVPVNPRTGANASSTDPSTWSDFNGAVQAATAGGLGIGFVLTADLGIVGLDFDHAVDAQTRQWVAHQDWVGKLWHTTYLEQSPSGTGIRAFLKGKLPAPFKRDGVEAYFDKRFLTVTGFACEPVPLGIGTDQEYLDELHAAYGRELTSGSAPAVQPSAPSGYSDDAIKDLILHSNAGAKFTRLMGGAPDPEDIKGGDGSASSTDYAFASLLAFWCRHDYDQIERLMRMSKLLRAKWDERRGNSTWLRQTVERAAADKKEFYQPPQVLAAGAKEAWGDALPLFETEGSSVPFPVECLPVP